MRKPHGCPASLSRRLSRRAHHLHDDGTLDLDGQRRCIDFMIDAGSEGLCILANFSEQFVLTDEERETVMQAVLAHVAGRVPVIVTTTHFASHICAERSRRAGSRRRHGHDHAALSRRDLPRGGAGHRGLLPPRCPTRLPSHHDPGRAGGGHAAVAAFLAKMAREIDNVAYFKIEVAQAAAKLRTLLELGGEHSRVPGRGGGGDHADGRSRRRAHRRHDRRRLSRWHPRHHGSVPRRRPRRAKRAYERWLPLINHENRQCGLSAAKILMQAGGVIRSAACAIRCRCRIRPPRPS